MLNNILPIANNYALNTALKPLPSAINPVNAIKPLDTKNLKLPLINQPAVQHVSKNIGDGLSSFMSSGIGSSITGLASSLGSPQKLGSNLSKGITSAADITKMASKALESVPVVGQFAQIGNMATGMMNTLGLGNDGVTGIDAIVGNTPLGFLNFGVGSTNKFGLDKEANSTGAFSGSTAANQKASDIAGKKLGWMSGGGAKRRLNDQIESARITQNKMSDIVSTNKNLLNAQGSIAADLNVGNQLKKQGGFNPIAVGKKGFKLTSKDKMLAKKVIPIKYNLDGFDSDFEQFRKSLPINLQDTSNYRLKRLWELNNKPKSFDPIGGIFTKQNDGWHAPSVAYNKDTNSYEFLKPKTHPTVNLELDWFNSDDAKDFKGEGWQLEDDPNLDYYQYKNIKKFKNGGTIEQSLIPSGALHAHKNHLNDADKDLAKSVTAKGVPVVTFEEGGEIEQHAEIERGEIIFRLEISKKLEELWKDGSDKSMIEAGKLITKEIIANTKDNSGEYELNYQK